MARSFFIKPQMNILFVYNHVELYHCVRIFQHYLRTRMTYFNRTILDENDDTTNSELVLAALTTANTRLNARSRFVTRTGKNKDLKILPPLVCPLLSPLSAGYSAPQSPLIPNSPLLVNTEDYQSESFLWCWICLVVFYLLFCVFLNDCR